MRVKLDENLGKRGVELLRQAGHDVVTVAEERLWASEDGRLLEVCRAEDRCLVTLDMDFGNPLLFKPWEYDGIAVLRLPSKPSLQTLLAAVDTLNGALKTNDIRGKLWIVQLGRIREYEPPGDAAD